MLKPSNLSKMLSKHSSNCTQIVFPSAHNIFNIWEALRQANYVSTSEFNVFALCKFTWNNVYISASEDSKDVQHVAKLPGTSEAFFWSLVQQGGYRPTASVTPPLSYTIFHPVTFPNHWSTDSSPKCQCYVKWLS